MKNFRKRIGIAVTAIILTFSANLTIFAAEDLRIDVGGVEIDVEKLAEKNGVDPYELREAIENGMDAEKSSPFSDLVTARPNTEASEFVEETAVRTAGRASTKATKTNQDATAYVAKSGALTASGKTPEIGMCAMHIDVTTKSGSTSSTKVKLGTTIYMEDAVKINGTDYLSFVVEDRGKPSNRTTYWIDVYFGQNNSDKVNYNAAINYGVQTVSYYYYY